MAEQTTGIRKVMATARVVEGAITMLVEIIGVALLLAMVAVVSIGVFTRYVLATPVPWSDETSRFMLVWASLLGAAVGVKKGSHYGILMLLNKFPYFFRQATLLGIALGMAVFIFILVRIGANLTMTAAVQTSPALGLKMSWVYSIIPVSGTLMMFYLVLDVIDLLTTGRAVLGNDPTALTGADHKDHEQECLLSP
jgi:TRAP-type C4-dicarboxylate transport system permease small subunit